jgi:hypothetical protein
VDVILGCFGENVYEKKTVKKKLEEKGRLLSIPTRIKKLMNLKFQARRRHKQDENKSQVGRGIISAQSFINNLISYGARLNILLNFYQFEIEIVGGKWESECNALPKKRKLKSFCYNL